MMRLLRTLTISTCAVLVSPLIAVAQERLCDTQYEDCREALLQLIRNERIGPDGGIDVAFWYMQDWRYATELKARHQAGVRVRILVDQRANASYGGASGLNDDIINDLRAAGIPMREKFTGDIMHLKMMLFHGQNMVEFSKANYGPWSLAPNPNGSYDDEAVFFTNDPNLTNSFRRRFDDLWTNTSLYRNLETVTGTPVRRYPFDGASVADAPPIHPSMNFPPEQNFATRSESRYDLETQRMDVIVYRITDSLLPNAVIRAVQRGVPVRIITEPDQYRDVDKRWHSAHIDRMYMEGVRLGGRLQIKHAEHPGLMHQASVVLHGLREVIFGSSNWTTHSAIRQDEHNYFYRYQDAPEKLWFFDWFAAQFENKWNDAGHYVPFQPQPPPANPQVTPAASAYITPVNGASGLPTTSVTLTWEGGPWSHLYDIQMGTTPTTLALVGPPNQQLGSPNDGQRETLAVTNLQPGTTYFWRIVSKTWALQFVNGPVWSFTTAGTPPGGGGGGGSTPYGGTAASIPGVFQAENFDEGGEFVAYYDATAHNSGGVYRSTAVDIATTTDTGGGHYVGWTRAGEWLKYTVNVTTPGTYTLQTRLAALGTGGSFYIEVDGTRIQPSISVPNTGAWDAWQTVPGPSVSLSAGPHVVRVVMEQVGSGNAVAGFNWFQLGSGGSSTPPPPPPPSTPAYPNGTPAPIPGRVQAENFDNGAAGVAYYDTTTHNSGGAYRSTAVDIATTTDTGGGFYVGWTKAGEWLTYTVNVTTDGTYRLDTRLAALGAGGRFRIEVAGRTASITVPNTGAWDAWQTVPGPNLSLSAGTHVLRVVMEQVGTGNAVAGFNWFEFVRP